MSLDCAPLLICLSFAHHMQKTIQKAQLHKLTKHRLCITALLYGILV